MFFFGLILEILTIHNEDRGIQTFFIWMQFKIYINKNIRNKVDINLKIGLKLCVYQMVSIEVTTNYCNFDHQSIQNYHQIYTNRPRTLITRKFIFDHHNGSIQLINSERGCIGCNICISYVFQLLHRWFKILLARLPKSNVENPQAKLFVRDGFTRRWT